MTYTVFSFSFQTLERLPVVLKLGAKGFQAFMCFFLLGLDELFLGGFGVVVYCSRKGGQGGGYLSWVRSQLLCSCIFKGEVEADLEGRVTRSLEPRRRHRGHGGRMMTA